MIWVLLLTFRCSIGGQEGVCPDYPVDRFKSRALCERLAKDIVTVIKLTPDHSDLLTKSECVTEAEALGIRARDKRLMESGGNR